MMMAVERLGHAEAAALLLVAGFGLGQYLPVLQGDLHLPHMGLEAARLRGTQQCAPIQLRQRRLRRSCDLQCYRLRVGAHQVGHARQMLAGQDRNRAERGHHGGQEGEQHQLLGQREAGEPLQQAQ